MPKHYISEATELFSSFAKRHGLAYEEKKAPVELLWEFPVQSKLTLPIILCLQNTDELSFGVEDFWSYFFPFPKVANEFTRAIDAWVEGRARIIRNQRVINLLSSSVLETTNGTSWTAVYTHIGGKWIRPEKTIQNSSKPNVARIED